MQTMRFLITVAALAVLAGAVAAPAVAAAPRYLDLTPHLEKWFHGEDPAKCGDLRMRTLVGGNFNGMVLQTREILQDDLVLSVERMLFARDVAGDVLYHGDPEAPLAQPVLWVDAPLEAGKTWTDSSPVPGGEVHYVFAVLEERPVVCPAGTFNCHRVFVAEVQPDGSADHHDFWYNPTCGLIRCVMDGQGAFILQKSQILDGPEVPDDELDEDPGLPGGRLPGGIIASPNPFNPDTAVSFDLRAGAAVTVEVFDLAGRRVRTLARAEQQQAGRCVYRWDGRDSAGRDVASGTYLVRVKAGLDTAGGRMLLVR